MFESITARAQRQILDDLYVSASTLAENSNGLLVAYEPDLKRFEYASLSVNPAHYRIEGQPIQDCDQVDFIAESVDKRYKYLPLAIKEFNEGSKDTSDLLGAVDAEAEVLRSGQNTVDAYEHIELLDVALGGVAKANHHRRNGVELRSILVASKAVQFLGINLHNLKGIPPEVARGFLNGIGVEVEDDDTVQVPSFLKIAFDATYLTFPSTKTHEKTRRLHREAIKGFNSLSVTALAKELDKSNEGSNISAQVSLAAPGTTVKLLDTSELTEKQAADLGVSLDGETYVIGSINPAIGKFAKHALTFAHALRLGRDDAHFRMDKVPLCVSEESDVRRLGSRMVAHALAIEPDRSFIQDWDNNLVVSRINSANS